MSLLRIQPDGLTFREQSISDTDWFFWPLRGSAATCKHIIAKVLKKFLAQHHQLPRHTRTKTYQKEI